MDNSNVSLKLNLIEQGDPDNEEIITKVKVKPLNTHHEYKKIETSPIEYNSSDVNLSLTPIVFFINKKSGSKEGESILKMLPQEVIKFNINVYDFNFKGKSICDK